ncbi:mechanosensitive ion channel domain-containing protein [Pseudidiomarina terrestris]|uniref:mechanosensitive ion channel domain-containing protein n=1 Tax=Pseudidiomarina terrestris TaxID=2820060 RepID=UPI002653C2EC|nr:MULTISPECIES: mechanosensitive ion channel domain-containing protein [unclassified Pseudidiomarina]MDN7134480.1 mechanosensitive ion channel [Pseudidiomarina sp. 1ASP75-5]MEA3587725.1 mechanosensitive ion channel [Pseudidiomarina sp. 1APP75-27a]
MEKFLTWVTDNQELIVSYTIKFVVAILILIIGKMIANSVAKLIGRGMERKGVDGAVISFLSAIVKSVIFIAAVLMALSQVGVQTTSFIAILGAAGLAIGLSLQGSLSNMASGVLIITFRPFRAGEYVEAGGVAGTVQEVNIFQTVLKTPDNKVVFVPNAQITSQPITNYSREDTRRVDLLIGVSYDADLHKTKEVLESVLKADDRLLEDPAWNIQVHALNNSSVDFIVRPWVNVGDYWPVYWDLMREIKIALDKNDIGIPYPQMDVHLHKETSQN